MQATINNTVQFASFIAEAKHIFEEVRTQGPKIIMDEGQPACVLLSHAEYERIMDELADAEIERMAAQRLSQPRGKDEYISQEDIDKEFCFTEENLKGWEEVEIE